MKHLFTATVFAAALFAAGVAAAAQKTVTLAVENMYCASCPFIVKRSLAGVEGVTKVIVSYKWKKAEVTFDDSKTTIKALTDATLNAGYPSRLAATGG